MVQTNQTSNIQFLNQKKTKSPLTYWAALYQHHQKRSLCLDIETEGINKPITIIGLYQPGQRIAQATQLIQGIDLTQENLIYEFQDTKLLITFNGLNMDIPRIQQQFPNTIPKNTPVLDLYRIARRLGMDCNLTTLEQTFQIDRLEDYSKKKHIAVKLWKQYQTGSQWALDRLLEYNKQDTINLYPLAEKLCELIQDNPEEPENDFIEVLEY